MGRRQGRRAAHLDAVGGHAWEINELPPMNDGKGIPTQPDSAPVPVHSPVNSALRSALVSWPLAGLALLLVANLAPEIASHLYGSGSNLVTTDFPPTVVALTAVAAVAASLSAILFLYGGIAAIRATIAQDPSAELFWVWLLYLPAVGLAIWLIAP